MTQNLRLSSLKVLNILGFKELGARNVREMSLRSEDLPSVGTAGNYRLRSLRRRSEHCLLARSTGIYWEQRRTAWVADFSNTAGSEANTGAGRSCSCWSFLQQQRRPGWLWERPKRELLGAVRSQHHVCNGRRSSSAKVIVLYFIYFKHSFRFEIFLSFRQLILPLFGCNSANKFQSILQVSALEKHSIKMIFLFCFN